MMPLLLPLIKKSRRILLNNELFRIFYSSPLPLLRRADHAIGDSDREGAGTAHCEVPELPEAHIPQEKSGQRLARGKGGEEELMTAYLLDTSVIAGYLNIKDSWHKDCETFFLEHKKDNLAITCLTYFELKHTLARRILDKSFSSYFPTWINIRTIPIDKDLINKSKNIFVLFPDLKGADLTYACVAYLHGFTLVTTDDHFKKYDKLISLIHLGNP